MKLPILSVVSLLLIAATSCNRNVYVPNTANTPLLKEKHEFKASLSLNNIQTAYAVTDHFAVMANGQYVYRGGILTNGNKADNSFGDSYVRGGVVEGAVGYFQPLDPKKKMIFEVFGGFGTGGFNTLADSYNTTSDATKDDYRLSSNFTKTFIQPGIGFAHHIVEASFSTRVSMVNFYNLQAGAGAIQNDNDTRTKFFPIGYHPKFFVEPAFTVRVGYRAVKYQFQFMHSIAVNGYNDQSHGVFFQPVAIDMGVAIDIAKWYKSVGRTRH
ncbi:hypothetical protein [Chitinophaga sp. Cy-1792]|uniref:hypothetical protein n=1 Tax=Chitinophaga sp. Cy-1792 TaxID=2608339 RepID=UPI00141FD15B|nr:hypothetical protein [Chitinophaga sp. Cy-1792]NIG56807.1 hypothetical protein [Chitinophaga sp. Cy-1792]